MYIIIKMSSKVETTSTPTTTEKKTKKVVSKATKPEETVTPATPVETITVAPLQPLL